MEIEVDHTDKIKNTPASNTESCLESGELLEGYVTQAKDKYKRKTYVKPREYHLISKTGSPWTRYVCPVCQMLGNDNTVYKYDHTCPLCNVNLLWEDNNKVTYGDEKDFRKRTNNWHVTGFVGNSSYEKDVIKLDYILTVDYYITKKELRAALLEKYDYYLYIEIDLEMM